MSEEIYFLECLKSKNQKMKTQKKKKLMHTTYKN